VLVDRFTSTAALWMGDALPVSPTEASVAEPLVSALEPSKMMLYKEQNLIVTKSTENDDPVAAREATTSNAQLQAESKFDFEDATLAADHPVALAGYAGGWIFAWSSRPPRAIVT
ncbi:hypothetical protein FOL46_004459, partial [Perkinsus olseni]